MTIGLIAMITGFFAAVAFVPETLAPPSSPPSRNQEAGTLDNLNAQKGFRGPVRDFLESSVLLCRWMTRNSRVVVLLSSFLVFHLGEQADALLMLQYVARRLGWTIGEVCKPMTLRYFQIVKIRLTSITTGFIYHLPRRRRQSRSPYPPHPLPLHLFDPPPQPPRTSQRQVHRPAERAAPHHWLRHRRHRHLLDPPGPRPSPVLPGLRVCRPDTKPRHRHGGAETPWDAVHGHLGADVHGHDNRRASVCGGVSLGHAYRGGVDRDAFFDGGGLLWAGVSSGDGDAHEGWGE